MIILHFFHIFNKNYDSESGTKFISTDLYGGPFLHSNPAKINTSTTR